MIELDGDAFTAVLFDAGGVLVLPDPTVLGPLLAAYGGATDIDAHHRAHYAGMAAKSADGSPEHDWAIYDRAYVTAIGVHEGDLDEAAEVLGRTRHAHLWRWPIPDALSVLPGLRDRSDALGVVSNAAGQIESVLARAGICQVGVGSGTAMRCVIDSHVVGVAKPDPAIFDHALDHFPGVERSQILYVGDSVTMDVGGARAAGLEPVLIDPYDDHAGADFRRITSLRDLLGS